MIDETNHTSHGEKMIDKAAINQSFWNCRAGI